MTLEIERKFLAAAIPFDLSPFPRHEIRQGYLSFDPELRIRQKDDRYYLTEKSGGGLVREEHETEISEADYRSKEPLVVSRFIEKTRYLIPLPDSLTAELDIYGGFLRGLVAVEVEFDTVEEAKAFTPPAWFGREITEDPRFKNKNLSGLDQWTTAL
jgi:CYTH domain-containing protein